MPAQAVCAGVQHTGAPTHTPIPLARARTGSISPAGRRAAHGARRAARGARAHAREHSQGGGWGRRRRLRLRAVCRAHARGPSAPHASPWCRHFAAGRPARAPTCHRRKAAEWALKLRAEFREGFFFRSGCWGWPPGPQRKAWGGVGVGAGRCHTARRPRCALGGRSDGRGQ